MSAPVENGNRTIAVSFTALLYGVVIDASLHRVEHLALTPSNLLLFISLTLVVQDFFFYHEDMKRVNLQALERQIRIEKNPWYSEEYRRRKRVDVEARRRRKERKIFFFDALLLATWYVLSLAAHEAVKTYLLWLAVFFISVAVWDTFANPPTRRRLFLKWVRNRRAWEWLRCTHWPVGIATAGVAWVAGRMLHAPELAEGQEMTFAHWTRDDALFLALPLMLFLAWRRYYWVQLRRTINDDIQHHIELIAPVPVDVEKGIGSRIERLGTEMQNGFGERLATLGTEVQQRIGVRIGTMEEKIDLFVNKEFVALQTLINSGNGRS
ncbi:MAG TPA: hypothetical protein VF006_13520 [Longimicrobium sp.]